MAHHDDDPLSWQVTLKSATYTPTKSRVTLTDIQSGRMEIMMWRFLNLSSTIRCQTLNVSGPRALQSITEIYTFMATVLTLTLLAQLKSSAITEESPAWAVTVHHFTVTSPPFILRL